MTPSETERRIHQLDNDVQSICEMLSAIQGTQTRHGNRLREQAEKLDRLDTKMDALDTKMDALDTRIMSPHTAMDSVLEMLRSR